MHVVPLLNAEQQLTACALSGNPFSRQEQTLLTLAAEQQSKVSPSALEPLGIQQPFPTLTPEQQLRKSPASFAPFSRQRQTPFALAVFVQQLFALP